MTKTISLSDDAYRLMIAAKQPGESFSELARRTFGKPKGSLLDLAGAWQMSDGEYDRMIDRMYADRDSGRHAGRSN